MYQMTPETDRIARCDRLRVSGQADIDPATWYVEVLDKKGWQPLRRRLLRGLSFYDSYEEAVAAAVREWRRSDRPARAARIIAPSE